MASISPVWTGRGLTSDTHLINHSGHRQLNAASYRTVIVRLQRQESVSAYVARRTAKGKSKRDYSVSHTRHSRGLPPKQNATTHPRNGCSSQLTTWERQQFSQAIFAALKTARVHRTVYPTKTHAKHDISHYIETFYNTRRRHSA